MSGTRGSSIWRPEARSFWAEGTSAVALRREWRWRAERWEWRWRAESLPFRALQLGCSPHCKHNITFSAYLPMSAYVFWNNSMYMFVLPVLVYSLSSRLNPALLIKPPLICIFIKSKTVYSSPFMSNHLLFIVSLCTQFNLPNVILTS